MTGPAETTGVGSAYPYAFDRAATTSELQARFADLEPGAASGTSTKVAGRIMSSRSHGKVAFADLQDASGRVQLFAQVAVLGDDGLERFLALGVGDLVGAAGEVVMTRRGELSVKVERVELLAPCRRPMPEKWHGVTDVETRHRQRYLDLVMNPRARDATVARAAANRAVRSFLDGRGFLEVETPLLQPMAGGAVARPFVTHHNALDLDLYLRIAPELYLKRLLIGGLERVYELNRSFRNEGVSARHNPEFTMLEAYEAYVDFNETMSLVEALVRAVASAVAERVPGVDLAWLGDSSWPRVTMFEAIEAATGRDFRPEWEAGDRGALGAAAAELGVDPGPDRNEGQILVEVFEATVERGLNEPTFVVGFPKQVSPLAKDHRTLRGFTEQADLVIGGIEIAPIYSELNDPDEQRRRFEQQAAARVAGDEEAQVADEDYLAALEYGMPPAGGFGLGIDRLLMVLLAETSIREVILFPTLKPER